MRSTTYWFEFVLNNGTAWYLTYLAFSTVAFGAAIVACRRLRLPARAENVMWRVLLVVVPFLAGLRVLLEHIGSVHLPRGVAAATVVGDSGQAMTRLSGLALAVAVILAARLVYLAVRERSSLSNRRPLDDGPLVGLVAELARSTAFPVPRLTESDAIRTPIALGTSEICVPVGIAYALDAEELRAVLVHELEHLRRRDTRWAVVAALMERLFPLQPFHRLVTRRLIETAEFSADEAAADRVGDPATLVRALVALAQGIESRRLLSTAFLGSRSLLSRRAERLLATPSGTGGARPGTVVLALLAVVIVVAVWATPAFVPACDCVLLH